jgi:hypothetical protein
MMRLRKNELLEIFAFSLSINYCFAAKLCMIFTDQERCCAFAVLPVMFGEAVEEWFVLNKVNCLWLVFHTVSCYG